MNIIIVFPKKEIINKINSILTKNGFEVISACTTGAQALYAAGQIGEGIILCGVRYTDMMYYELKDALPDTFKMVVIATSAQWNQYGESGVMCLPLPIKVYDMVETMEEVSRELERLLHIRKNKPKKRSLEEQGIIDRAKQCLIEEERYTEEEAHRFIQKQSMDSGSNMVETASYILEKYTGNRS